MVASKWNNRGVQSRFELDDFGDVLQRAQVCGGEVDQDVDNNIGDLQCDCRIRDGSGDSISMLLIQEEE